MSQNRKKKIIHPIAIDLGAKATGVYTAHYVEGTELSSKTSLNQKGKIYQLEKDAYTLLMRDRTAQRHQKRGFDRRQMVKRLFKLIWCEGFGLEWNSDIQQTISFLLNRRGFSFLTEQYNAEILSQFPTEVYNELPEELPKELPDGVEKNQDGYDFDTAIQEWTKEGQEKLDKIYEAINKEPNRMASRQVFISRTKEIKKLCTDPQKYYKDKQNKNKSKLSDVSRWIIEEWQKQSSHQQTQDFFSSILKEWDHWKKENKTEQNKESPFSSNTMNFIKYLEDRKENIQKLKDHLPEPDTEDQEIKNSFWNFKSESFKDLDKKIEENAFDEPEREESKDNDYQKKKLEWKKTHLNHLAFAIYQNLEELKSGGRHRSKYFEEVKNVLEYKNHSEKQKKQNKFLKVFCDHLHSNLHSKRYKPTNREPLTVESLTHLIGHLSNLELKPLRKYFNDFKHQEGDYWCEKRLNKYFDRWLDKQWRVTEKDKDKSQDEAYDYNKLKKCWKTYYDKENKTGSVIDFWLREDPKWTIPPYQNNNNRRPPHCQSLILNPVYLDSKYPQWQEWLSSLKELSQNYLEDFESELKGLQSGQKKPYFNNQKADQLKKDTYKRNQKNLDARILQFIFDRVKKDDPLNLNEIFSHAKKIKQLKRDGQDISETKSKLEDVIKKSELPDHLETTPNFQTDDLFEQKSFLHLLCKYYKLRQRAKDGRLFIHPRYRLVKGRGYEDTGRFEDRDCLLTYCNHKPRQKRYQLLKDLAAVLQISNQQLEKFIDSQDQNPNAKNTDNKKQPENQKRLTDDKVVYYLEGIDKLKTNCEKATKEQKDRRGSLKLDIQKIFALVHLKEQELGKSLSEKEIKAILKTNSKVKDAYKLYSFCQRAKELCLKVTKDLYNDSQQENWKKDIEKNPAKAVYFLAQINNLVFKERTGYSNTCAVCSMDNAHRMQMQNNSTLAQSAKLQSTEMQGAKAQRLPAISTRLIDGAVMKMAHIVSKAILDDEWDDIEKELKQGNKVLILIITESNRFDFEPDLKALKGQKDSKNKKEEKTENLSESLFQKKEDRIKEASQNICPYQGERLGDNGEIDHIIPRASEHGTLNDEANLIYASKEGNQKKGNNPLQIQKLHNKYKQKLFGTTDHQKIMKWIEEQIGHGKGEDFKFGKYTNLINLTSDEQRAFRHALFLTDHELHQKVIDAISSRSKTFVNGTQPHFAQVLANNFYKKAKRAGWQDQICFDWFGVEAQSNTRGDGIYDLRKDYEKYSNISEFKDYAKEGNSQKPYSHLIDATLAFAIAVDQHKKEGSLKLNIDQNIHLEPMNRGTGEVTKNLIFNLIKVPPNQLQEKCLEKRKAYTVETHHRQLLSQNKKEQIKISYKIHRDNSIGERFFPLIQNDDGTIQKGFHPKNAVSYQEKDFHLLRDQEFLIRSKFSDENYQLWFINKKKAQEFLMDIGIREADKDEKKQAKLLDGLSYQTIKTKIQTALTPNGKKEPQTVKDAIDNWSKCIIEKKNQKFISKDKILLPFYSSWEKLKSELDETDPNQSLQKFLQQCLLFRREEDHQHPHQKVKKVYSLPILTTIGNIRLRRNTWDRKTIIQTVSDDSLAKYGLEGKDRPHTILSQNSVPKKHYSGLPQSWNIEPIEWMTISQKDITDSCIQCAKVRHKDSGRCDAKITMNIADIGKISIPFISKRDSWKGKIKLYEDKENFKKAKETNRSDYHLMSSDFQWFSQPFKFPKDRNEVKIKSFDDIVTVEFTIPKTTQVKQWLLNNKTS